MPPRPRPTSRSRSAATPSSAAKAATDETLQDDADRGYTFYMDNELYIEATGTTDGGLTYGSYAALEARQRR